MRRLLDWFNQKFFLKCSELVVSEKVYKRIHAGASRAAARPTWISSVPRGPISAPICAILVTWRAAGIGSPATGCLMPTSPPRRISPALDFLGDVPWEADEAAKLWYPG